MSFRIRVATVAALAAISTGCVTINIYFPAAAAEQAADRIIEEVWQLRDTPPAQNGETNGDTQ